MSFESVDETGEVADEELVDEELDIAGKVAMPT